MYSVWEYGSMVVVFVVSCYEEWLGVIYMWTVDCLSQWELRRWQVVWGGGQVEIEICNAFSAF